MKLLLVALIGALSASASFAQDIVVYGGTPGGLAAAISVRMAWRIAIAASIAVAAPLSGSAGTTS